MNPRAKLLPRILFSAGLLLITAMLILATWQTSDALPRCLAGALVTTFFPAALGLLLIATGLTTGVWRRWWVGCLTLPLLLVGATAGGMLAVGLVVQRKLTVEQRAIQQRCGDLQQELLMFHQRQGVFPPDLSGLVRHSVKLCGLEEGALDYQAGGGTYLLAVPASSLDLDGAVFFAGPRGHWTLLGNDERRHLDEALTAQPYQAIPADDPAATRYAALWRQVRIDAIGPPPAPAADDEEQSATDLPIPRSPEAATAQPGTGTGTGGLVREPEPHQLQPMREATPPTEEERGNVWTIPIPRSATEEPENGTGEPSAPGLVPEAQ